MNLRHTLMCAAVALAWQLSQPSIVASIVGANSPAQLAEQLPALDLDLSPAELQTLDVASVPFTHYRGPASFQ